MRTDKFINYARREYDLIGVSVFAIGAILNGIYHKEYFTTAFCLDWGSASLGITLLKWYMLPASERILKVVVPEQEYQQLKEEISYLKVLRTSLLQEIEKLRAGSVKT